MEKKHFHLLKNVLYWVALIISLLTLVPTNRELIDYFSQTPEPVVICFFGDHQPKVETAFLETVHGGGFDNLQSEMLKYKVPFFIWANYDMILKNKEMLRPVSIIYQRICWKPVD